MGEEDTAGDWYLASLGLTTILFRTSCAQDSRRFILHTFVFSRFPHMLISPLPFGSR